MIVLIKIILLAEVILNVFGFTIQPNKATRISKTFSFNSNKSVIHNTIDNYS